MTPEQIAELRALLLWREEAREHLEDDFPEGAKWRSDWRASNNKLLAAAPALLSAAEENARLRQSYLGTFEGQLSEITRLRAENARLREALLEARAKFMAFAEFHAGQGTPNAVSLAKDSHNAATAIDAALEPSHE